MLPNKVIVFPPLGAGSHGTKEYTVSALDYRVMVEKRTRAIAQQTFVS